MREAFNYMFKDNMFRQKALTYFGFAFIGTFFINLANSLQATKLAVFAPLFMLAGIIIMFIPSGYLVHAIKALIGQNENFILPAFNFKNNFVTGFKFMVAVLILSLIFGIVFAIGAVIFSIIGSLFAMKILAVIGIILLAAIPLLIILYYTLSLNWIFATTEAFTSFLQFKKASGLIKNLPGNYNKCFWIFLLINLTAGIISGILLTVFGKGLLGIAFATFISVLISLYIAFVNVYLTAKSIKA